MSGASALRRPLRSRRADDQEDAECPSIIWNPRASGSGRDDGSRHPAREGFERILRGRTGALIVLGNNRGSAAVHRRVPARCDVHADRAARAGEDGRRDRARRATSPDRPGGHPADARSALETIETGTRHRTADRVAQQTGVPVVTVCAVDVDDHALYVAGQRASWRTPATILSRANQALQTLERYADDSTSSPIRCRRSRSRTR